MLRVVIAFGVLFLTPAATTDHSPPVGELPKLAPVISPIGETLYRVNFDNLPCRDVMEEIERVTGLMLLSKDTPDIRFTVRFDWPVTLNALFDQLNRQLEPHEWFACLKAQSFCIYPLDGGGENYRSAGYRDIKTLAELPHQPKRWYYRMALKVGPDGFEHAQRIVTQHFDKSFHLDPFGSDGILVWARVSDLQKFVAEMGDHIKK